MIQKNDVMLLHIHKNKVDRIELTDIARHFIQKMKEERIFLEQYKRTYNLKNLLSYILIFFSL